MLKCKVTKKELKENYSFIFSSTQDLYFLFKNNDAKFYYANVYGWRFDVYQIDLDTIITTGYEHLEENKNQKEIDNIFYKYNKIASKICSCNYNHELLEDCVKDNLDACIKELKEVMQNEN